MAKKPAKKRVPAKKVAPKKKAAPKKTKAAPKKPARGKDGNPAGWPTLSPYMTVRNGQASVEFYAKAFGFKVLGQLMRGEDGSVQHAGMGLGGAMIMFGPVEGSMGLQPPAQGASDSLSIYVYVPDVDALAVRARRSGATEVQAPTDQFWRDRTAVYKDIDGYHWTFATHLG
ncbi:MAG TPA: VOC family protein [Verrucomicrobiae bacterium]|nr:VOC family protein [Verrucomicrobiae bacterium]